MNLNQAFLTIFITVTLLMMAYWLYRAPSRGYGFPFFAGAIALALVLPQGIAFSHQTELMPPGGFIITMLFASLCTVALWAGFAAGLRNARIPGFLASEKWDDATLLRSAKVFIALGVFFNLWLNRIDIQRDPVSGNWTGLATILNFFSQWLKIGMIMALYIALKKGSREGWWLFGVAMIFVLPAILIGGRRADIMQLLAAVLFSLWFVRHRAVPRFLFVAMAAGMSLFLVATGMFRGIMNSPDLQHLSYWEKLSMVDWSMAWSQTLETGGGGELLNCVYGISAADELMKFDFGIPLWNLIVWNFIPGQMIGAEVKQSLYLWINWPFYHVTTECYPSYSGLAGSMWMGYTDAFQSYWWLGWIVFLVIAWCMGRLYRLAADGNPGGIILYIWIFTHALHIIPALTYGFWTNMFYFFVFCLPIIQLCRVRRKFDSEKEEKLSAILKRGDL